MNSLQLCFIIIFCAYFTIIYLYISLGSSFPDLSGCFMIDGVLRVLNGYVILQTFSLHLWLCLNPFLTLLFKEQMFLVS